MSLLQFDFSADMLAKLEAYERDLAVGIVLNRVTDTELATHLLLNSERFQTWPSFEENLWMSRVQGQQRQELTRCVVEPMIRTQHR